jgi:mannose-6-phosphate isomerase
VSLYPLKFKPRFLEKMWGGRKIESVLGKRLPPGKLIGESWELCDFPPGVVDNSTDWISSEVADGPLAGRTLHELVGKYGRQLHGDVPLVGPAGQFPILIKFLDARQDLSVQVHPDRQYAATHPGAHLKSEAWYIVQADPGSRLLKGLAPGTTRQSFAAALAAGRVESLIRSIPVREGECFYLPSGTLHALGAGILAAEVQTPSDTTFRVFDFNRIDPSTSKPRKLHVEQALDCVDFSPSAQQPQSGAARDTTTTLVSCEYFKLDKRTARAGDAPSDVSMDSGRPSIWIMLRGRARLRADDQPLPTEIAAGDTVLLPAVMKTPTCEFLADSQWLHVQFP